MAKISACLGFPLSKRNALIIDKIEKRSKNNIYHYNSFKYM